MLSPEDENVNTISERAVKTALEDIKRFCFTHDLSVAVAESVSSGVMQMLFSAVEEAGLFFEGGLTTYSCQQKSLHFNIPLETCESCNGAALDISQRMALQICDLFQCKLGLSLTGYASAIPEQNMYELYAFGAIALNGKIIYAGKINSNKQSPEEIREDYARILIVECAKMLKVDLS